MERCQFSSMPIPTLNEYIQRNIFEILLNQTEIRLYSIFFQIELDWYPIYQSENSKCNLISGWFNKISKRFLCVCSVEFLSSCMYREEKAKSFFIMFSYSIFYCTKMIGDVSIYEHANHNFERVVFGKFSFIVYVHREK